MDSFAKTTDARGWCGSDGDVRRDNQPGGIENTLDDLFARVDKLETAVNRLASFLSPVLVPDKEEPSCIEMQSATLNGPIQRSAISLRLREVADRVGWCIASLNKTGDRVDL